MEKIKRLEDVILPESGALVEVIKPKRLIIMPDGGEDKDSYAKILAISPSVKDVKVGDLVVKYAGTMYGFTLNAGKPNERQLALMLRGCMNIVVTAENFIDPDKITEKVNV